MMVSAGWISLLANHLWQSTVFAAVAALLALILRRNQARIRYWLWLSASIKFLVPFDVLVALGHQVARTSAVPIQQARFSAVRVSAVMGQVAQPFPQFHPTIAASSAAPSSHHFVLIALAVWGIGFLCVACFWWRCWLRIYSAARRATLLVVEAGVPVLSTPALLEPGIFGVFHPVLLLPQGITDHLTRAHLEAILAHELCHVRRRDNLAAAIHMAIEAIFWFYPLVWWIGSRLVDERERACDEEVLRLGNQPTIYAESILKTCQFYLESPLVCVSGISGSDLKKRIVRIMAHGLTDKLSFTRKLLLALVGTIVVTAPVLFGFARQSSADSQPTTADPLPSFEVASVKPNRSGERNVRISNTPGRFSAINVTPKMLIQFAYNIKGPELSGGPSWIESEHYDIDAKTGETPEEIQKQRQQDQTRKQMFDIANDRRRLMVQSLLADRFKLTLNRETKDLPIYALMVAKNGPKFHETVVPPADPADTNPPEPPRPGQPLPLKGRVGIMMGRGRLTMNGAPIGAFANALSEQLGRNVIDKTGLAGNYDLNLQWTPDEGQGRMFGGGGGGAPDGQPADAAPAPDASSPSIFTALQEQLGLRLESEKGPVQILVIDHIEQPSEN